MTHSQVRGRLAILALACTLILAFGAVQANASPSVRIVATGAKAKAMVKAHAAADSFGPATYCWGYYRIGQVCEGPWLDNNRYYIWTENVGPASWAEVCVGWNVGWSVCSWNTNIIWEIVGSPKVVLANANYWYTGIAVEQF